MNLTKFRRFKEDEEKKKGSGFPIINGAIKKALTRSRSVSYKIWQMHPPGLRFAEEEGAEGGGQAGGLLQAHRYCLFVVFLLKTSFFLAFSR